VYGVAPALVQHHSLSPTAKLVAVALLMHYNRKSGLCYPTEEVLAAELTLSTRTVMRAIDELRQHGVSWETRAAPRGQAKGRAHLYDVEPLLQLCQQPMRSAQEVLDVAQSAPKARRKKGVRTASSRDVTKASRREVTRTAPRASGNRSIEQNQSSYITNKHSSISCNESCSQTEQGSAKPTDESHCEGSAAETNARGDVTKTPDAPLEPHGRSKVRLTSVAQIHEQRLAPNGLSYYDGDFVEGDAWLAAAAALRRMGGEPFNPESLQKCIDQYGEDRVWFHAQWLPLRLAVRREPPRKPVPFFLDCVENDHPVNPQWLDSQFSRVKHGCFTEEQRGAIPTGDSPLEWTRWMTAFGGRTDDLPDEVREQLRIEIKSGNLELIADLAGDNNGAPSPTDSAASIEEDDFAF
jgi:biotin operon repressor